MTDRTAWELEIWYESYILKSGRRGKSFITQTAWYCPLRTCRACGLIGPPKRIQERNDMWAWPDRRDNMLCMGCWNKERVPVYAARDADEIGRLSRRIIYELQKRNKRHGNENG